MANVPVSDIKGCLCKAHLDFGQSTHLTKCAARLTNTYLIKALTMTNPNTNPNPTVTLTLIQP